jgi:hypothetical protein
VIGLTTRRHRATGLAWRDGVAVASAALLWRHPRVSIAFPNGEQADGEVRGIDGGTDLAVVTFTGVPVPAAERVPAPTPRVGDAVFAVGRDPSGQMHASFGHVGAVGGEWRTWRGGRLEQLIRLDGGLPPGSSARRSPTRPAACSASPAIRSRATTPSSCRLRRSSACSIRC